MSRMHAKAFGRSPLPALATVAVALILGAAPARAAEGELGFGGCVQDLGGPSGCATAGAIDRLDEPYGVAVAPAGGHVYAAADDALTAFAPNGVGGLAFVEDEVDGTGGVSGLGGVVGVAVAPDGGHVYATGFVDDSVAAFARDPATGALDFVASYADGVGLTDGLDGARGVAVSPDGRHVYVASSSDDSVAVFVRDPATGALGFFDRERDGLGGVDGLDGAWDVAVSADGRHVYVTGSGDDAVAAFVRDATSGGLGFVGAAVDGVDGVDGLHRARGVTVAPDGRHVYATGFDDDALAAFARDPGSGGLGFVGAVADGVGGVTGLDGAGDVTISPDGKHLYVAATNGNALTAFTRDGLGGGVVLLQSVVDGAGADGLRTPWAVAVAPDGRGVYVAGTGDDAVSAFERDPDTTPPQTAIASGPVGAVTAATTAFRFASDDPGFTAGFECSVDGAPFTACASPLAVGPLALGPHGFAVRAVDTAGNVDPTPAARDFAVAAAPAPPPEADRDRRVALRILGKRLRVNRRGVARLRLRCPASEATPPCRGRVGVRTRARLALGTGRRARKRRVVLARRAFTVAAGRARVVRVRLSKPNRRLLASRQRARRVAVIARVHDGAGNRRVVRRKMRAVAPRPERRRRPARASAGG